MLRARDQVDAHAPTSSAFGVMPRAVALRIEAQEIGNRERAADEVPRHATSQSRADFAECFDDSTFVCAFPADLTVE